MSAVATNVMRIPSALKEQAESEGRLVNRRAVDQIEHWARIGRTLERMQSVSLAKVRQCLSAQASLDDLGAEEKAIAYATLHNYETHAVFPDFGGHKHNAGLPYTELDRQGRVVRIHPDGRKEVLS